MLIKNIIQRFNMKLAGEQLQQNEAELFIDAVIDDINDKLDSCFPVLSKFNPIEFPDYKASTYTTYNDEGAAVIDTVAKAAVYADYDVLPDKYIRTVIISGAAFKFFSVDEEGALSAPIFEKEYIDAIFRMQRDYIDLVPVVYQSDNSGGISDPFYLDKLDSEAEQFLVF
jgi:hypothetical protein